MPTHEINGDLAWMVTLIALYMPTDGVCRTLAKGAEEANRAEERRETFRRYSEDCPSLDRHADGNAYERLCTDPRHPYHRDSRPQCDSGLCPHLNPSGHAFRGCCACR